MGGYSKWNVLEDREMSSATRGYCRKPLVVITGLMTQEAEKGYRNWNPIIWTVINGAACSAADSREPDTHRREKIMGG